MVLKNKKYFTTQLLAWYAQSHRPLPWKGIKDPYLIWLSEVILQQTRTEQGMPYYHRFKEQYPTIQEMAAASEDEIMKLWQGLGYYSRARNMHFTAKYIANELNGEFPRDLKSLLTLKGVGTYTAAAIASFAFDLPHAVVDGNVYRVLSRFFGIDKAIDSTDGKRFFGNLAQELLSPRQAATYNQAIMDLGATVCLPKNSKCSTCFLQSKCVAFGKEKIDQFPVKSKKIKKRTRHFNYLIIIYEGKLLIKKREERDIWQNLYDFPLLETEQPLKNTEKISGVLKEKKLTNSTEVIATKLIHTSHQQLTHQKIMGSFWEIRLNSMPDNSDHFIWVDIENLSKFAFPRIISLFLEDKSLNLGTE